MAGQTASNFFPFSVHCTVYNPLGLFLYTVVNTAVSEYAGIEPRSIAVYALTVRADSYYRLHLIQTSDPKYDVLVLIQKVSFC